MIASPVKSFLVLTLLAVAGCATVPERDLVLENARVVVYAARNDPQVVSYAPEELRVAIVTLGQADDLALHGGSVSEVDRLALAANQRAEFAQRVARTRSAEAALAAQQAAASAQVQADLSRRQAEAAQLQAAAAQRQAEEAQRQAAAIQLQTLPPPVLPPPVVVAIPPDQIADLPALPSSRGLIVTLNDTMFYPGSAELQARGQYTVERLAAFLNTHPERTVAIEGFADTGGYAGRKLSEDRARTVQAALVTLGVDPRRTVARGYGRDYPIASNDTAAGRQMNRRVEIVVSDRGGVIIPRG
jgi:outer membrane protein OmpA-like peptidoglycan-associated protein